MKAYARPLILILAAIGLAASIAALYVHYRLISDPTYSSFCDVSATVSCQAVFSSSYGTVFGVPVAAGGAIWSLAVLLLAAAGMRPNSPDTNARVGGYIFLLSTLGLAVVFYFAYASFFILKQACPLCMTMYASVIGVFLVSSSVAGPLGALASRVGHDVGALRRSPTAVTLAVVWLAVSVGLVALFPREQVASAQEVAAAEEPAVPVETLTPEQRAEWEKWLDAQPRANEALPAGDVKVLVLKFNDYQCPACRQTWALYRGIIAKYETAYPGVFKYESRDFPLEAECGAGGVHGAACEAAAAVRMAREKGRDREVEAALFNRQSPSMTRDEVKATLAEVAQITDFDARYEQVLEAVRADAQLGQKLGVSGTPTFFLNGIRLSSLRPAYFDAGIAWALNRAGVQAQ